MTFSSSVKDALDTLKMYSEYLDNRVDLIDITVERWHTHAWIRSSQQNFNGASKCANCGLIGDCTLYYFKVVKAQYDVSCNEMKMKNILE